MAARILLAVALISVLGAATWARTPAPIPPRWPIRRGGPPTASSAAGRPLRSPAAKSPTAPSHGSAAARARLPNQQGQVWREYDISPYTARVTTTKRPEQAIVDWILRETGYEVWHSEPLGILSATPRTLRVYHTPEMQALVAEVVDRFVASEAENQTFSLRVMTSTVRTGGCGARACCTPCRCRRRASALALAPRGCGGGAGRIGAAVRLSRTQFAPPADQQRPGDGGFLPAAAVLRPRRDVAARHFSRLHPAERPDRRGLLPGIQPAAERGPAADRRGREVQHRPGGADGAGGVRRAGTGGDAAAGQDRGPADVAIPLPRALPLAGGPGVADRHGHGGPAGAGGQPGHAGRPALAASRHASPRRPVADGREQGSGERRRRLQRAGDREARVYRGRY